MMSRAAREWLAGGAAGAFFVGVSFATGLGFPVALGLAAAVYLGIRLTVPVRQPVEAPSPDRIVEQRIAEVEARGGRFAELASRSRRPEVAQSLQRVSRTVAELAREFRKNPDAMLSCGEFLEMHLPSALSLAERHVALSSRSHLDAAGKTELEQSASTLDKVAQVFEQQLSRLLADDVRELQVDRLVFEEILRLDPSNSDPSADALEGLGERRES